MFCDFLNYPKPVWSIIDPLYGKVFVKSGKCEHDVYEHYSQVIFTCSKSVIEALGNGVKYVQI